ncbi:MAG: hypothetical protein ACKVTZ_00310 [Bacteroidia bacterium]
MVENRLIGIVGNCLVMPVARGYQLDPTYTIPLDENGKAKATLLDHYQPLTPIPPYRVSVPTRGVFAEAVQGACNACEKIDDTRFWKWEEHPIDEPTAINPINTPTPVVTNPNLTAKDFASPMINIQNAPNAPDPQGLGLAANLLSTKGLFDNITGLDQNQKNAMETLAATQLSAQGYAQNATQLAIAGKEMAMQRLVCKERLLPLGINLKYRIKTSYFKYGSNSHLFLLFQRQYIPILKLCKNKQCTKKQNRRRD